MKNKYKLFIITLTLLMVFSLNSCGNSNTTESEENNNSALEAVNNNAEENTTMLTDRQIQILQEMSLPKDYELLTDSQKSAITRIERALTYLENSYGLEFVYNGYVAGGLDGEYLTAYVKGDLNQRLITVNISYENGEYHYSDDYLELLAAEEYKTALQEKLMEIAGEGCDFYIHAEITHLADSDDNIIVRASGDIVVFVLNNYESKDDAEEFVNKYTEWISSVGCQYPTGAQFYIQEEADFYNTNEYNYSDQIHDKKYSYYYDCSVDSIGSINIWGG